MTGHAPACQGIAHYAPVEGCLLVDGVTHYRAPNGEHHLGRHDCPEDVEAVARSVQLPRLGESVRIPCDDPTCSVCGRPEQLEQAPREALPARRRRYRGPDLYDFRQLAQLAAWLLVIVWLAAHW